jgi:hypothetical protein
MAKSSTSFKKGQTGNAQGRKPGKTSRGRFREQVDMALPAIIENLVKAAQGGDMQATKIILDRCVAVLKPTTDTLSIPDCGTLADQGAAIITAMARREVSPDQARAAIGVLAEQAKLIEQSEITSRLEAIESWLQKHTATS